MTVTFQPTIEDQTYNGWSNYETWNVALWINNSEGLYHLAQECGDYETLVDQLRECNVKQTPDGVKWNDDNLNYVELNEMLEDLSSWVKSNAS